MKRLLSRCVIWTVLAAVFSAAVAVLSACNGGGSRLRAEIEQSQCYSYRRCIGDCAPLGPTKGIRCMEGCKTRFGTKVDSAYMRIMACFNTACDFKAVGYENSDSSETAREKEFNCSVKRCEDAWKACLEKPKPEASPRPVTKPPEEPPTVVYPPPAVASPSDGTGPDSPRVDQSSNRQLFDLLVLDLQQLAVEGDPKAMQIRYEELCSTGLSIACRWRDWHKSSRASLTDAGNAFRELCAQGEPFACTVLGWSLTQKPDMPPKLDPAASEAATGADLFRKACDKDWFFACRNLGRLYEDGVGVPKDLAASNLLYRKACNGGDASGCFSLARMFQEGSGIAKDEAQAAMNYRKACEGGIAFGCQNLGVMYENGAGVGKDESQAAIWYRKACDGGVIAGCSSLGSRYMNGTGVAQDNAQAIQFYRKGCDGGDAGGCSGLGLMYENGMGVAKDVAQARVLLRKGCEGGFKWACDHLKGP